LGKGNTDTPLDPRQGLVRINAGQGCVPLASRISRSAMVRSTRCKPARNTQGVLPTRIGHHRALLQFEIERGAGELLRNLEQLLGKRYQLFCRVQPANYRGGNSKLKYFGIVFSTS
jgi:hypothetical protein